MNHLRTPEQVSKDALYCVTIFWNRTGIIFHGIILVGGKACVKMEQWHNADVYNLDRNTVRLSLVKGYKWRIFRLQFRDLCLSR